jgi:rhamnose utilization protein RhaD (predicted bifunctional aldolase and dehydrogenase)
MSIRDELLELTLQLGDPAADYVIIGEGNTSARLDDDTFDVKASGQQMATITADGFVSVRFEPVLAMLDNPPPDQKAILKEAMIDGGDRNLTPSIETSFHGMLLHDCGVNFVGHTHPTTVNQILCGEHAETFARNRLFPDEAVLCGPESVYVPYAPPGIPLAQEIRQSVREYMDKYGEAPKVIHLGNHGMIALGMTAREVLNITMMTVKAAAIFQGVVAIGEPVFMDLDEINTIYQRPDEQYRRRQFVEGDSK